MRNRPSSKRKTGIYFLPLAVIGLALIFLLAQAFIVPMAFVQTTLEQETHAPTLTEPLPETPEAVALPYNFIDHLPSAKGADNPSLVAVQFWKIGDAGQKVLYAHPAATGETRLEYNLLIPSDSLLRFSLAMSPECWNKEGDGVSFKVYMEDEKGIQQLFERYIDPKHDQEDRKWRAYQIDLAQYGGRDVKLIFVTDAGPAGDIRYDWAGWGNPELVSPPATPTPTPILTVTPAISPTFTPALSPINTPTAKRTSAPKATAPPEKPKPTSPSPPPTSARVPTVVTATVISDLPLNLRAGPGTDYAKIGRLEKGTSLEVLARNERGDWLQVRLERGREGWVAAEYVQIAAEISSLPVAAGPPTPTLTPVSASEGTPTPTLSSLLREVEVVTPTATPTSKPLPDPSMMPPELKGKITFLSDREVRAGAPYVMDPDGTNVMRLTERWVYDLACELDTFSPDRSQRLFVYDGKVDERGKVDHQIWVQNLADGWIWPLVNNSGVNIKSFYVPGWDFDPAWSPDSRHIAYVSLTDGNEEIHVVDKDDTARPDRRLTANTWESDRHPSYSPDGSQIVFWSNRDVGRKQIWIMNADGSEQRCLLCNNPYNDWDPVWIKW